MAAHPDMYRVLGAATFMRCVLIWGANPQGDPHVIHGTITGGSLLGA